MRIHAKTAPARAATVLLMLALSAVMAGTAGSARADESERLRNRALAATCAQCHGTDGYAVPGEAMVKLAGLPQQYILEQLTAFRIGQRPATIMHQITRGYSQQQLETLAAYFAALK